MRVAARFAKSAVGVALLFLPLVACGGGGGEGDRQAAEDRRGVEEAETTRRQSDADRETPSEPGDRGESGRREPGDGCEIVTKEEVEELLGREVQNVPPNEQVRVPGMVAECLWEATTPDPGTVASDLFQFQLWDGRQYYGAPPGSETVEGVGDDAYVSVGPSAGPIGRNLIVGFVDGDNFVLLSLTGVAEADVERMKERMVDYAREVAEEV